MKHIFKGLNHVADRFVGVRSLRAFVAMMTIAIFAALPYADANASVNKNNFAIKTYKNTSWTMPAASNDQQDILDAASTLDRSFGIAYNRTAGRIFMYTLTRQASTYTKEFNGYYARANNSGTNFAPFTGTAIFKGTYWQAAANDEYGNVVFGQKSEYNTTNNFPNCLLPLMSTGSNDQAASVESNNMGTSTISIPKTVQVCGPDYPNRW